MYVAASARPIDTAEPMRVHDQTKLVVIEEKLGELILDERFARYATTVGFRTRACEDYDPESNTRPASAGSRFRKPRRRFGSDDTHCLTGTGGMT